jgi:lysophospholipase L1-like esterase
VLLVAGGRQVLAAQARTARAAIGGNDVIHRRPTTESTGHLDAAVRALRRTGCQVVVGTCPDLGALTAVPQPLRGIGRQASRRLADAQREVARRGGAHTVTLSDVVGPHFLTRPDEMFALDRFHPSAAGYRRIAKALLPSVLAVLGSPEPLPPGHHAPH